MSDECAVLRGAVGARVVEFDAAGVRGVLLAPLVTEFPGGAPSLRGLFAWRERVVPLVSLEPSREGRVAVVLEARDELIAVELDAVETIEWGRPGAHRVEHETLRALVQLAGGEELR